MCTPYVGHSSGAGAEKEKMNRTDAWLLHISNGLVTLTGLVYTWMAYFSTTDAPYAIVGHSWQPHVQHAHIWVAPFFLLVFGHLWRSHIGPHLNLKTRRGRRSGIGMLLAILPMTFSGYAIQTAVDPLWRTVWVVVHLTTSALWVSTYLIHLGVKLFRNRLA